MISEEELIKDLRIAFNWEDFDFLRTAFKYGKNYENVSFICDDVLEKHFGIKVAGTYGDAYSLSRHLTNMINSNNLKEFLRFAFHCFSKISNYAVDRRIDGKIKKGNSRILGQILQKDGRLKYMHKLKHIFIELELLPKDFEFGNSKFILKTKLS